VKAYLVEMDIPDNIIRKMMAANSENMHFLTSDEARDLGNNPAMEELSIARCGGNKHFIDHWNAALKRGDNRRLQELLSEQQEGIACGRRVKEEMWRDSMTAFMQLYGHR
jgi:hypothetical protein